MADQAIGVVALPHGLWDAARGIAVWLTLLLTATPVHRTAPG